MGRQNCPNFARGMRVGGEPPFRYFQVGVRTRAGTWLELGFFTRLERARDALENAIIDLWGSLRAYKRKNEVVVDRSKMQSTLRAIDWRTVTDYPNYEVSDTGLVRNKTTIKILKPRIDKKGYAYVNLCREGAKPRNWYVHRLVAIAFIENPDGKPGVDHIDRNIRNTCVSNLRWCTKQENVMNQDKHKNNTSGFKGVTCHKGKWRAKIQKAGKEHHLGFFKSAEEATAAYDKAALEMHGEFACINPAPAPKPKIPITVIRRTKICSEEDSI